MKHQIPTTVTPAARTIVRVAAFLFFTLCLAAMPAAFVYVAAGALGASQGWAFSAAALVFGVASAFCVEVASRADILVVDGNNKEKRDAAMQKALSVFDDKPKYFVAETRSDGITIYKDGRKLRIKFAVCEKCGKETMQAVPVNQGSDLTGMRRAYSAPQKRSLAAKVAAEYDNERAE